MFHEQLKTDDLEITKKDTEMLVKKAIEVLKQQIKNIKKDQAKCVNRTKANKRKIDIHSQELEGIQQELKRFKRISKDYGELKLGKFSHVVSRLRVCPLLHLHLKFERKMQNTRNITLSNIYTSFSLSNYVECLDMCAL